MSSIVPYLMPVSLAVMVYVRLNEAEDQTMNVLFFATFQWLWAVKNWVAGPLKTDSGLFTWLAVMAAAWYDSPRGIAVSTGLLGVSFGGVFLLTISSNPFKNNFKSMAKRLERTPGFCKLFTVYMLASAIFWGTYSYEYSAFGE